MTKHALNGFLALSVAYTNELARICERVGADASEVERGLKRAEDRPAGVRLAGPPLAGGTLLRDVGFLGQLAAERGLPARSSTPSGPAISSTRTGRTPGALELLDGAERPGRPSWA